MCALRSKVHGPRCLLSGAVARTGDPRPVTAHLPTSRRCRITRLTARPSQQGGQQKGGHQCPYPRSGICRTTGDDGDGCGSGCTSDALHADGRACREPITRTTSGRWQPRAGHNCSPVRPEVGSSLAQRALCPSTRNPATACRGGRGRAGRQHRQAASTLPQTSWRPCTLRGHQDRPPTSRYAGDAAQVALQGADT